MAKIDTIVIPISSPDVIERALTILKNDGVIAVPTDTVYGIACLVHNRSSIQRLFAIKERDHLKAIPVLIGTSAQTAPIARAFSEKARKLAKKYWPGPLTLVVEKNSGLPEELTTFETVGIRMPNHNWLRDLMKKSGPLAATSANISGGKNTTTANEVYRSLGGRIELLIDGGTCLGGIPSTVVDTTSSRLRILREGAISEKEIKLAAGR